MTDVGQIERLTQNRVVDLFHEQLDYKYLGNWEDRENNSNIEEDILRKYLYAKGYSQAQGSGKSLIMVWIAKWIRENINDARVLIITDRDELDKQIE